MTSNGIFDKVAVVGMGCTQFGELWDRSTDDLLIDAVGECLGSTKVAKDDVDA
ncbi:MAG: thiolase, partial [Aeromicrobium sp.]|nr:thiolase [Aeromicrobium sp.]